MAEEHTSHHVNYFLIFGALCVLTALSVVADVIQLQNKLVVIVIVLAIAAAKALFVLSYFMHLKFEGNWKYLLLTPTIILACGIPLALLPDIGVHYYTVDVPQVRQRVESGDHAGSEHHSREAEPQENGH